MNVFKPFFYNNSKDKAKNIQYQINYVLFALIFFK
jgi:hypothetical protein